MEGWNYLRSRRTVTGVYYQFSIISLNKQEPHNNYDVTKNRKEKEKERTQIVQEKK